MDFLRRSETSIEPVWDRIWNEIRWQSDEVRDEGGPDPESGGLEWRIWNGSIGPHVPDQR